MYSDGVAFTAQFTRPVYESNEVRPQDVELLEGDETFYADPGRSQCFTAMKGISNNFSSNCQAFKWGIQAYFMHQLPRVEEAYVENAKFQ